MLSSAHTALRRVRTSKYIKIPKFCTNRDFDHFCGHFLTKSPCPLGYLFCIFMRGDKNVFVRIC